MNPNYLTGIVAVGLLGAVGILVLTDNDKDTTIGSTAQSGPDPRIPSEFDAFGNRRIGWAPEYFFVLHDLFNSTDRAIVLATEMYNSNTSRESEASTLLKDTQMSVYQAHLTINDRDKGWYGANITTHARKATEHTTKYVQAVHGCLQGQFETRNFGAPVYYTPGCQQVSEYHNLTVYHQGLFRSEYERVFGPLQRELWAATHPEPSPQPTSPGPPGNGTGRPT